MEKVELKFQYTQSEYLKAERQYLIANKTIRKYDIFVFPILLLLFAVNMFFSSFNIFSILIFVMGIAATAMECYVYILMPMFKFKQTAKYHEGYTLIFSKEIICFKTPSIESEMKWNIYSALWISYDFYYLIQSSRIYTIIPKRIFKEQNEKETFEEIAQSNLKTIIHI